MATDLVIVLSSDWVGSTATRAELGEDTADALQELHDTLLRRVIDGAGGQVVKHSGDGVLATFHSATAALGAAAKIQDDFTAYRSSPDVLAPIDIRLGLAAGDVKHQSGDIFGMPVIEAVRLQGAAQPNEILCSDLVRVLSQGRGGFEFEDAGRLQLKGLPSPVQALRVRHPDRLRGDSTFGARTMTILAPAPRGLTSGSSRRKLALAAAAAVVVVAAAVFAVRWSGDEPSPAAEPRVSTGAPQTHSIAVLPFDNLSASEDDAYFAIGIHEAILDQLTKLGSLKVVARTTVRQYVDTPKTISEIARELNVDTIMEGSVQYADGRVLVTTQLIDGDTDAHLWSENYEREFSNIFAIQSDIAVNVAQALKAQLLPEERERLDRAPTESLRAYDLYLSATARYWRQSTEEILQGITEIEEAVRLDPSFAEAWVLRADLRTVAQFLDPTRSAEHQQIGIDSARRAIALDPKLGRAHVALGFALFNIRDWIGSEEAFRTALALNTPLGDVAAYGVLKMAVGDFAYARDILQEARQAVPQNPTALGFLVTANALLGDRQAATEQYELGARLFSPWGIGDDTMLHMLLALDDRDAARRIPATTPLNAEMLALLDTPEAALRELHERDDGADPETLRLIAMWAALLGDPELALRTMRESATRQGGNLLSVWLPQFAATRRLPEFKTLLRDLGVVAYWQEYGWPPVCRPLGTEDFTCD